jgi:uncharacterized membrane protein
MKRTIVGLLVVALVALAGCSNNGTPGGPGATGKDAKKPLYGQADNTFNLSVPSRSTALQPGEAKEITISIKRGKNLDEDVTLTLTDVPSGVTFDPASPVIKRGDTDATFTFKAGDEAPAGDFTVKVTGHPTKGADASNEFKLTVSHKDTFHLSAPFLSTTLKQGDTKEVVISIKRDKNFDQDVTLTFTALPTGVTVEPANPVIKQADTEAKVILKGAADASVGDFTVKVTGHPAKGADASHDLKVTVAKQTAKEIEDSAAHAKRDEYAREMHKQLDALDAKYEDLKGRAAKAEGQAKKDLDKQVADAKAKRDAAAGKLDELKKADASRWEKLKGEVGSAFADLKKMFK